MLGWSFVHLERIHLLWLVLVVLAALAILDMRARNSMARFLSPVMQARLVARPGSTRLWVRLALLGLSLAAGVGALMRPQAAGVVETVTSTRASADVVFVLDVSRSMLADDAAPTRLSRAKAEISQLVERLPNHRVGLVAFAGRAVPLCPLTPDHSFFNLVLSGVDTNSVSRGGTRIGEAVRTALRSFPTGTGAKLIVLITDGEDHESYPLEAAKEAKQAGVHIIAVGLGSEDGAQIHLVDPRSGVRTLLEHEGKPVVSKLDAQTLREMALATEGAYVPAGTSALDLDSIVEAHIQPIVAADVDGATRQVPAERYPLIVLASIVFLMASLWVGSRHDQKRTST